MKKPDSDIRVVIVRECPIELCQFLKFAGASESGGAAKQAVAEGRVQVNGAVETRKRKQLCAGDEVIFAGERFRVALA